MDDKKQDLFNSFANGMNIYPTQGEMDDFLNALNKNGLKIVAEEPKKAEFKCRGKLNVCKDEFLINNPNPKMDFDDHRICIICSETYPAF